MFRSSFNHRLLISLKRRMPVGKRSESDIFFFSFTLSAIVFLIPISLTLEFAQMRASANTAYAGLIVISTCIWIWKTTEHIKTALVIYEMTLLSLVLVNAYLLGGVTSPVMVWLGVVPVLPLFIASLKWSYTFLIFSFMAVLLFYALSFSDILQFTTANKTEQLFAALMFCTFIMAQTVLISTVQGTTANRFRRIAKDNQRLSTLTDQLGLAHEHKDKFLSHVSHEMRTPLNVIHGYLELIRTRQDLPIEIQEQIKHLSSASTHMVSLVNDLLDYSQIHQGQFTLAFQPVELPALLNQVFNTLQNQAHQKNLELIYTTAPMVPRWVQTDPTRLTQIIFNLIGNAIKFTSHGQVRLDVDYMNNEDNSNENLVISVIDTGPGIPAAVLNKIYSPFYQLHTPEGFQNGDALKGNGLGLAIVQGLVKKWQGDIKVISTLGVGSKFIVSIPMFKAEKAQFTPALGPLEKPKTQPLPTRILVVDDHAMNRMVAAATIRKNLPECQVEQAENGQQALQKMAIERFDVVLLDIIMPDLSGIEVLQTVRQTFPEPYRNVRTIAFTANVEADIKDQCERTGFDGFLSKPFNAQTLMEMLSPTDSHHPLRYDNDAQHVQQ